MSNRVLCVDDDPNVLAAYQRGLRKQFTIDTAESGEEALRILKASGPYAVLVADMQMPGTNGLQLLTRTREAYPDTVRVMLTGNADQNTAVEAVNQGQIFRFLNKPCSPELLGQTLSSAIQHYQLVTAERELLEKTLGGSVQLLTDILALVDAKSFGRALALREQVRDFLKELKMSRTWDLEVAAMLCQIGFVTLLPQVAVKIQSGAHLTPAEDAVASKVPEIGSRLLANIPRLESVASIVLYQEKHYDGGGFPRDAIAGQEIPIGARILKVLIDLTRLEESGKSKFDALAQMRSRTGFYDPTVLEAAYSCFDVYLPEFSPAQPLGRAVNIKELQAGHRLLSEVKTHDGLLIVTAGTVITSTLLERLHNFASVTGLQEPIYVIGAGENC